MTEESERSERLTPWWVAEGLGKYAMTDELIALRAENERLREALKEAIECVEFWADYASPYFKDKHGLEDNLIKLRAALSCEPKDAPR